MKGENSLDPYPRKWERSKIKQSPVVITGRTYQEIAGDMLFPSHYFTSNQRALSIGEGLSNFARTVHNQWGTNMLAVDPVYSIPGILELGTLVDHADGLGLRPSDEIITRIEDQIRMTWGENYGLGSFNLNQTEGPIPSKVIAASATDLPFKNGSIDTIVSYRFLQHVDTDRAVPEMMRVLRYDGEARHGLVLMTADPFASRLINAKFHFKPSGTLSEVANNRIRQCMSWAKENQVKIYIIIRNPEPQGWYPGRIAEVNSLVFRKDSQIPMVDEKTEVWSVDPTWKRDKGLKLDYLDIKKI